MNVKSWRNLEELASREYRCGYCGKDTGNDRGFVNKDRLAWRVVICPNCYKPTFFDDDKQFPGAAFGVEVQHLPPDIATLHAEARNCMSVNASTAAVLCCRKLLMNIAVAHGAAPGQNFVPYVNHIVANLVPPLSRGWVDKIRDKGNEATHEIPTMSRADAEEMLLFVEMLLKTVFEYPQRAAVP